VLGSIYSDQNGTKSIFKLIPKTPAMTEYKGRDSEKHRETRFLKEELGIKKEKDRILGHLILKRNMLSQ
jgi:hypothetical protein